MLLLDFINGTFRSYMIYLDFINGANKAKLISRIQELSVYFDRPCIIVENDRMKNGPFKSAKPSYVYLTSLVLSKN